MKLGKAASRLAIVTGAAGGIGRDIVQALVRAGYSVAAWDMDGQGLDKQFGALAKKRVVTRQCDVSSEADVENAVAAAVKAFGVPYLLVNNAATRNTLPLEDLPRAVWDRELSVNLTGCFNAQARSAGVCLPQGAVLLSTSAP